MIRRTPLNLISLENRDVPTTISVNHGVLTIRGSNASDVVQVTKTSTDSFLVSTSTSPAGASPYWQSQFVDGNVVRAIVFVGLHGDDTFTNGTNRPCRALGGNGDDLLTGGMSKDTLIGGNGDDSVFGGIGGDVLVGGAGDDEVRGEEGDDRLIGNAGNHVLLGGTGEDSLFGGMGNDWLNGGFDGLIDQLYGQAGRNRYIRHRPVTAHGLVLTETDAEWGRWEGVDTVVIY
jgi:Ca2+-binding RTX toxin-like protein